MSEEKTPAHGQDKQVLASIQAIVAEMETRSLGVQPMNFAPFDLEAAHIFKIYGDRIHEIEAMGFTLPLYSKNGWNPFTK